MSEVKNLKYVTDEFLDEFRTNFDYKYLDLYKEGKTEEIYKLFNDNTIKSEKSFIYSELVVESDKHHSKKENLLNNIKIIHDSFNNLSPVEAENEKLWIAMENLFYLNYHLNELKAIKGNNERRNESIKGKSIFNRGRKRSLMMNSLSRLWWIGYYTIDEKNENPYHYTKYLINNANEGDLLLYFSSNIVSNKEMVFGTLSGIKELVDTNKLLINRYAFTNSNKILNQIGGVRILDTLDRNEIKDIIINNLLETDKIKVP